MAGVESGRSERCAANAAAEPSKNPSTILAIARRTRLLHRNIRPVDPSSAHLSPRDHILLREPVQNSHDGGVGARTAFGKSQVNIANRSLAERPECVHAIEFERRHIENRVPGATNGLNHFAQPYQRPFIPLSCGPAGGGGSSEDGSWEYLVRSPRLKLDGTEGDVRN